MSRSSQHRSSSQDRHSHQSPRHSHHSHHSQAGILAGNHVGMGANFNPSFLSSGTYSQALGQMALTSAASQGCLGGAPRNYGGFAPYAGPYPAGGHSGSYTNLPPLYGGYGGIPTGYGHGGYNPAGPFAPPPTALMPPLAGGSMGPGSYVPPPMPPFAGGPIGPGSYAPPPMPTLAGGFSPPGSYVPPPMPPPMAGGFSPPGSYVPPPVGYGPSFQGSVAGPSQYAQSYMGYPGQPPYDRFGSHYEMPDRFGGHYEMADRFGPPVEGRYEMPDAFGHMDRLNHHLRHRSRGCC